MLNNRDTQPPLVSIVIPVYNGGNYLAQAVDSALAQTWANIEVIVVDDGSSDGGETARICAQYGSRIRYFYKVNGGVATALNYAIQVMKGEYFSWLSHDDLYTPDRTATMLKAHTDRTRNAALFKPVIVFSDFQIIDQDGNLIRTVHRPYGSLLRPEPEAIALPMHGCSLLIPRHCFELAGLFHPGLPTTQDADMWQRLRRVARFEHVPVVTLRSRRHEAQGSRSSWHLKESSLYWACTLDRLGSGFVSEPPMGESERIRRALLSQSLQSMPEIRENGQLRLERTISDKPISLLWLGDTQATPHRIVKHMRGLGYRISMIDLRDEGVSAILPHCRRLKTELVWLWSQPLENPEETLSNMIAQVSWQPAIAGIVHCKGEQKPETVLGPFEAALLRVQAFEKWLPENANPLVTMAHALVRFGGVRRYSHNARTTISAELDLWRRQGNSPGVFTVLKAYGWTLRHIKGGFYRLLTFAGLRHKRLGLARPGLIHKLMAKLACHRRISNILNLMVWRCSSSQALARRRLLRMHSLTAHFDPHWYLQVYPDVRAAGTDPLLHYLCSGRWERRDPSAGFSTERYLTTHPDVGAGRWHAVQHYELWGRYESRKVERSSHAQQPLDKELTDGTSLLIVYRSGDRGIGQLVRDLGVQCARGIRTLVLDVDVDNFAKLHEVTAVDCLIRSPLPTDRLLSCVRALAVRRLLFAARPEDEETFRWLAESLDCPYDLLHLPACPGAGDKVGPKRLRQQATNHYVLSRDTAANVARDIGRAKVKLVSLPDPDHKGFVRPWLRNTTPGECCRVAIFGDLTHDDAGNLLLDILERVAAMNLPFVFVLYGSLQGGVPSHLAHHVHCASQKDADLIPESVCRFNPHLAWVPCRRPHNAVFPLLDATMSGLAIAAADTIDARTYLAGRPLSWLLPIQSDARAWLGLLGRIYHCESQLTWAPRYPLEGFPSRDQTLCDHILHSLSG